MRIVASKGLIALSPEESLIFFYLVYFFSPCLKWSCSINNVLIIF